MKNKIFYVVISVLMLLMVFVQPVLAQVNNIPDEDKVIVKQKDGKVSQAEYIYTGKKIKPELVVTRYLGGTVVAPSEYVVTYDDDCDKCGVHTITFNYPKTGYTTAWDYYVVPGKTKKISMSAKNGAVTISWEAVPGATHYRFYMYNDSGRTELWWDENTIAAPKLSRTLTDLKPGKSYKIGIMALPSEDYMPTNQMKTFEFTVPSATQTTSKPTTSQDNTSSDASSVTSDVSSETEPTESTQSETVDKPTITVQPKEEKNNNAVVYIVVGAVVAAGAAAAVVVCLKKKK
ncbi:MAG: fibronectin type III domain-containing protein [Ruminococcaceae bacterium]|nr:fibronectin type III domain-containing protein [Oscillospiraceae bacterium]